MVKGVKRRGYLTNKPYTKGKAYLHRMPICKCGINWCYNDIIPKELPAVVRCSKCGMTMRFFKVTYTAWELVD